MMQYRSMFLSDVHLGAVGCQIDNILDFLRLHHAPTIYLIGDLLDNPNKQNHDCSRVLDLLSDKIAAGTNVIFVPGNHDAALRSYFGLSWMSFSVVHNAIHTTKDCKRYLITHGDEFDFVTVHMPWLARFGAALDGAIRIADMQLNTGLNVFGIPHSHLLRRFLHAANIVIGWLVTGGELENKLHAEAKRMNVDGIIHGHFHAPGIRKQLGKPICIDCGDWVDSCTAIVETHDGNIELLAWG